MNFAFIIDTSFSMMQAPQNKMRQLDIAKIFVENFIKIRQNYPEAKFDKYFLVSTNDTPDQPIILSSYEHELNHFHFQLRNLVIHQFE